MDKINNGMSNELNAACQCSNDSENAASCACCQTSVKTTARSPEMKRALTSRLNRVIGQLNGIKTMIDGDRYCGDILMQLSAAEKSVKSLAAFLLNAHLKGCIVNSIEAGDLSVIDEVMLLFKRFQG